MAYSYTYGSGTENDPYQVWTANDLDGVRDHLSSCFIQMADIDLGKWGDWEPIGGWKIERGNGPFCGFYNGNNFKIDNLILTSININELGLFGVVIEPNNDDYSILENINLTNVLISIYEQVIEIGGLVGICEKTIIKNCSVNAVVNAQNSDWLGEIGGTVGLGYFLKLENCNTNIVINTSIDSGSSYIGGMIGCVYGVSMKECASYLTFNTYNSYAYDFVGGLIGCCWSDYMEYYHERVIEKCSSFLNIVSPDSPIGWGVGCFVGMIAGSLSVPYIIKDCHAKGTTMGEYGIGGFAGRISYTYVKKCSAVSDIVCSDGMSSGFSLLWENVEVENCYNLCNLICSGEPKGIGGFSADTGDNVSIKNCYSVFNFDNQSGLQPDNCKSFVSFYDNEEPEGLIVESCYYDSDKSDLPEFYAAPKTTLEMTYPYSDPGNVYIGWDFNNIWVHDIGHKLNSGYPHFTRPRIVKPFLFKVPYYV